MTTGRTSCEKVTTGRTSCKKVTTDQGNEIIVDRTVAEEHRVIKTQFPAFGAVTSVFFEMVFDENGLVALNELPKREGNQVSALKDSPNERYAEYCAVAIDGFTALVAEHV